MIVCHLILPINEFIEILEVHELVVLVGLRSHGAVSVQDWQDSLWQIAHIFGDLEAQVTEWQLLVMDDVWLDLLVKPCDVLHVGQVVVSSNEERNRELQVLQVVVWWAKLPVLPHVLKHAMVKAVELRSAALRVH